MRYRPGNIAGASGTARLESNPPAWLIWALLCDSFVGAVVVALALLYELLRLSSLSPFAVRAPSPLMSSERWPSGSTQSQTPAGLAPCLGEHDTDERVGRAIGTRSPNLIRDTVGAGCGATRSHQENLAVFGAWQAHPTHPPRLRPQFAHLSLPKLHGADYHRLVAPHLGEDVLRVAGGRPLLLSIADLVVHHGGEP